MPYCSRSYLKKSPCHSYRGTLMLLVVCQYQDHPSQAGLHLILIYAAVGTRSSQRHVTWWRCWTACREWFCIKPSVSKCLPTKWWFGHCTWEALMIPSTLWYQVTLWHLEWTCSKACTQGNYRAVLLWSCKAKTWRYLCLWVYFWCMFCVRVCVRALACVLHPPSHTRREGGVISLSLFMSIREGGRGREREVRPKPPPQQQPTSFNSSPTQ